MKAALILTAIATAARAEPSAGQVEFRALFKELVETNTTASTGSCTLAAERIAARLVAAGYPDADVVRFADPKFPKDGGLVAVLHGTDTRAKGLLLLAHLDVVEAKREDWTRDPFTLAEEDGKLYGRGTLDDKTQVAIWTDTMIRLRKERRPRLTVKMALTCGEEGGGGARFNGAQWLTQHRRELIDADAALNEGAAGMLDEAGKPAMIAIQAGEKVARNFRLEITNPGGHSSRPLKDNAIYRLAHALLAVENHSFAVQFTESSRAFFTGTAKIQAGKGHKDVADAMLAMLRGDAKAAELVATTDPSWNATMHTTCVATMLDGGHAVNALPQRATANINCRIFPGVPGEQVRKELATAIGDAGVVVTQLAADEPAGAPPPLTATIVRDAEKLMAEMWPGVPVLPILQAGATDGRYLNGAGIPTYGIDGSFADRALNHIHGLNEYVDVASLYKDRDFLYRLVTTYIR